MQTTQTEKDCSIQVPYLTGTNLVTYYNEFIRSQWVELDYTDKSCEICGARGCASYHGFYTRAVIEPSTGFAVSDFPVMRFLCHGVGEERKSNDRTFSLLPVELVPFRKLSLLYMVLSVLIRIKRKLSLLESLDVIAAELCTRTQDILFVHEPALTDHEMIMRLASRRLWKSADLFSETADFPGDSGEQLLLRFLEYCTNYSSNRAESIRGPPGLAWDYYILNKESGRFGVFLFGVPFQGRNH